MDSHQGAKNTKKGFLTQRRGERRAKQIQGFKDFKPKK
jgi:hypothetical protein